MQVRALSAAAAIVVIASFSTACNPATKSKASSITRTQAPVATETQADPASPAPSTSSQPTASSAPTSASTVASTPATSPSAPAPATGGGGTIDVCSLLTTAQASAINGVTYGAATPQHFENGLDTCDYKNNGSANPIDIQDLTIQVISLPGCYAQLQDANGPGVKVAGVGDDAFGYEVGMAVKLGSRCIEVSGLTEAELKDDYAPDAAMAKIMIAKLG